jgi:ankyrin repeat protein
MADSDELDNLFKFILFDDLEAVNKLAALPALVAATNEKGRTPLHMAAAGSKERIITELVRAGADLDAVDGDGSTPLHAACFYSCQRAASTVQLLLSLGADPCIRNENGATPLHTAVGLAASSTVGILIDAMQKFGVSIDMARADGQTALHAAAFWGHTDAGLLLLRKGASVKAVDGLGNTTLHAAAFYGREALVQALLEAGADPDATTPITAIAALHEAAEKNYAGIVRLLLDNGHGWMLSTTWGGRLCMLLWELAMQPLFRCCRQLLLQQQQQQQQLQQHQQQHSHHQSQQQHHQQQHYRQQQQQHPVHPLQQSAAQQCSRQPLL